MQRCPSCGFWYKPSDSQATTCPRCGEAAGGRGPDAPSGRVPVARTSSWAEAGYFEDLLRSHEIEAEVIPRENFEAVSGHWHTDLILLVAEADAERAAQLIDRELRQDSPNAAFADADVAPSWATAAGAPLEGTAIEYSGASGPVWQPVLFAVLMGGLAYGAIRTLMPARQPPVRPADGPRHVPDLETFLFQHPSPWQQERPDGGRRLLWRDPETGAVHLQEDRDGDGQFDRHVTYPEK